MMNTVKFLLTLNLLASVALGNEFVFESYATAKVIMDCFGHSLMAEYMTRVGSAMSECIQETQEKNEASAKDSSKLDPIAATIQGTRNSDTTEALLHETTVTKQMSQTIRRPHITNKQNPFFSGFNWADLFDPTKRITFQNRRIIPIPVAVSPSYVQSFSPFQNYRTRRSGGSFEFYPEEKVRDIKNKVVNLLGNYTCVLRKMNYINDKDEINIDTVASEIKSYNLDAELKKDLLDAVDHCSSFASCMPYEKMATSVGPNLKRTMAFMKCLEERRFMACMKLDFRSYKETFNLKGLDGVIKNLEEDDQMLAVAWSGITLNHRNFNELVI